MAEKKYHIINQKQKQNIPVIHKHCKQSSDNERLEETLFLIIPKVYVMGVL